MKIIIPMAGMGKRMRPHTLTVPKPLLPIAGKPIVQRLVEDLAKVAGEEIEEVGFIIKESFGEEVENKLKEVAASVGAKGSIYYQGEALGTAHAVLCAKDMMEGKMMLAFADTLFKADFNLDTSKDGMIWVQKVDDPSSFGVVEMNDQNEITGFVEKPDEFISDLAIIGVYYFRDANYLKNELQYVIDNNILDKGEFQVTSALDNMRKKGTIFVPATVSEWLDCGNKDVTVNTNQRYLEFIKDENLVSQNAEIQNSIVIPPVYIGENVKLHNSVVGPHVSVGDNTMISDSRVKNSIIQKDSSVKDANIANSMIGNFVHYQGTPSDVSLGDFNTVKGLYDN
ncbi:sugar phosphate nucleotidyltransferase [Fulvivirgaceae bacterium BMA10]|uniref:Sugar phosphate nucleotidyltransferase n=1 Tax=Splendidivirga corallicola TaxID=3051826 RepID=A0ABT8KPI3_9BACT|nr:sugar phosphate nucleotidyltransferase [Fulvivirgaceae bacterium BMA10]